MRKDSLLLTAVLAGLVGFLYPVYAHLGTMQTWQPVGPDDVRTLILAMMSGLAAVACALGIDLGPFVHNVRSMLAGLISGGHDDGK